MQMLPVLYLLHHTFVERAGLNDLDWLWIFWMDFSTELRVPNLTLFGIFARLICLMMSGGSDLSIP